MLRRARVTCILFGLTLVGSSADAIELPARVALGIGIPTLPWAVGGATGAVSVGATGVAHLASFSLSAGFVHYSTLVPVTDPVAQPIRGLQLTASNAPGFFAEDANRRLRGIMPVQGFAKVCLFGACSAAVANVVVPLDVIGLGGSTAVSAAVNVTVRGAPWTTGVIPSFSNSSAGGGRIGPLLQASSTAQNGGRMNIVTPIYISTNVAAFPTLDGLGRVLMEFGEAPSCDVEVEQPAYRDGDTVRISRLHFSNPRAPRRYRVRIFFVVPVGGGPHEVSVFDRVLDLPTGLDAELAPVNAFSVSPTHPRGDYQLGCSLSVAGSSAATGDRASFQIE